MNIRYYYFGRTKDSKHQGIITIAAFVDDKRTVANVGLAFCSPHDQFSKSRAREIAHGRMVRGRARFKSTPVLDTTGKDPVMVTMNVPIAGHEVHKKHAVDITPGQKPSEAIIHYFNNDIKRADLPSWCRKWVLQPHHLRPCS